MIPHRDNNNNKDTANSYLWSILCCAKHSSFCLFLTAPYKVDGINPILQMKKWMFTKFILLSKWWN